VDAFTDRPFAGNPAGVVPDAAGLSPEEMRAIAGEVNSTESAFVLPPEGPGGDLRVRFFTGRGEVPLCGHATIAAFHLLAELGRLPFREGAVRLWQETRVGVLPVDVRRLEEGFSITMTQGRPAVLPAVVSRREAAETLGLPEGRLLDLPIEAISTGLPTLLVPLKTLSDLEGVRPLREEVAALCEREGLAGIHAFTLETLEDASHARARFFAPLLGIEEDPVTGTANGALGAYLVRHGPSQEGEVLLFEQGHALGRPGTVRVIVPPGDAPVLVEGSAVTVMKGEVLLER
jgi:PhzF family phenazine biosynthesis protein